MKELQDKIFNLKTNVEFETLALKVFRFQAQNNQVYNQYINTIEISLDDVTTIENIPFLPIELFKSHRIVSFTEREELAFTSSGTTGNKTSTHYIKDLNIYKSSINKCFEMFYGSVSNYAILALLPSYLEREGSSLVYMVNSLIEQSGHKNSGFFLNNLDELYKTIIFLEKSNQKTLILGVSFALLDFIEQYQLELNHTIIMETGGMKGRREEITRNELHERIMKKLRVPCVHSEYGMTELLSQAYSKGKGLFKSPPWMQILIRDIYDPYSYCEHNTTGGINIIDLTNLYSCSFIETQDLGRQFTDNSFEVMGRIDNTDIRGCNLMTQ